MEAIAEAYMIKLQIIITTTSLWNQIDIAAQLGGRPVHYAFSVSRRLVMSVS